MSRVFCILASVCIFDGIAAQFNRPNIVMILTDDQDVTLDSMQVMTQTNKLIVEQGLTFTNGFVSTPICCVTRSSIMSGRYVHNHAVRNNSLNGGCGNVTWQQNIEPHCFAPHVEAAGYQTFYAGKYLNSYGYPAAGGVEHIPQGWSDWYGLVGNSQYYDYSISNNGMKQSFGHDYSTDYYTDVLKRQGLSFLQKLPSTNTPPFLLVIATPSAHAPFTPAPQYNNTDAGKQSPRIPNWNVAPSPTKHLLMQQVPAMDATAASQSDMSYDFRHGTLKSVDDMVAAIHAQVESMGLLNNTYFFYTSDHGFHSGQFGMGYDKRQIYENDIRVPFYWKGPNIPKGAKTDVIALNIDIAPTLVELASGSVPLDYDGRSVTDYLFNAQYHYFGEHDRKESAASGLTQQFLIEYYGESGSYDGLTCCGGYPGFKCQVCDSWNNTYSCIRRIDGDIGEVNGTIYCQFKCYADGYVETPCMEGTAQGDGEYYNLDEDYYELNNSIHSLSGTNKTQYENMRSEFLKCEGQTQCNVLREGVIEAAQDFKMVKNTIPYDERLAQEMQAWQYTVVRTDHV